MTELSYRLVDNSLQFVEVARIRPARNDPPAELFDQLRRRGKIVTVRSWVRRGFEVCAQVNSDDVCPFLGKSHRM